jgi:hypothetical protein
VTSNHQITNLVSPNLSTKFSQFEHLKKKTNFSLVQNQEKTCLGPIQNLFSLSTAQVEKIRGKNLGKQDWWFDVTIKIYYFDSTLSAIRTA